MLVRFGSSMAWRTPVRDYRIGPHNILLAGGPSLGMGPFRACKICTIGSHSPIKAMADCSTRLPRGPTAYMQHLYNSLALAHPLTWWTPA